MPISNLERKSGKSNYGIGRTIRVFFDLIMVKFLLDYSTRPLQFFGLLGLGGVSLGAVIASRSTATSAGSYCSGALYAAINRSP